MCHHVCDSAGWEGPFLAQISEIRKKEEGFIRGMSRIKAFNMGLSYAITPLVRPLLLAFLRWWVVWLLQGPTPSSSQLTVRKP